MKICYNLNVYILCLGKKGEKGEGFDVLKSGDARVAMIGFPSGASAVN